MTFRLFRIVAKYLHDEPDQGDMLTFDVFVDMDGKAVFKEFTLGFMGKSASDTTRFLPFGLCRDGRMLNPTPEGRDSTEEYLLVFGKPMRHGEYITYSEEGDERVYRIENAYDLVEGNQ